MLFHFNYLQSPPIEQDTWLFTTMNRAPRPAFCPLWRLIRGFFYSKWYHILYVLYKIIQWLCGRGESTADGEVGPEEGRGRWNQTALSPKAAVLARLEEALCLQDGAGGRESAQSRRCLKGAGRRNHVSLRLVESRELPRALREAPTKGTPGSCWVGKQDCKNSLLIKTLGDLFPNLGI